MSVLLKDKFSSNMDKANLVFAWQVVDNLTVEEAREAARIITETVANSAKAGKVKLLVDNRFMERDGRPIVFTPEVNSIWEEAQRTVFPHVSHIAVLCSGSIMKMQMDRISRNSNISDIQKSFWNKEDQAMLKEAFDFLGISSNDLVKNK
ncbi:MULTISPECIES: hypothetical protein [Paenibacillus]|uniref:hypothetical protein n=1 Tax=Paenibacillus TaxID=44249 RepID=UPI00020D6DCB|nr:MULTISPECIES: hypothetical protein [Paenibacillus]EGL15830.1 hypothetical protein HMPREF9413_3520 [Paenibacillus sp. HGF7]EPD85383.1 hypothetical protein HMPREF1207_03013 [Paenibacillus sp. HGH0039]MBV6716208.1 hypothetical protein [Paenibacillus chitinolyticus]